jgi:hypothetical protein
VSRVRRRSFLVVAVLAACSARDEANRVSVAPSFIFPKNLLDSVTKVTLTVYDVTGDLDCNTATGQTTGNVPAPLLTKDLGTQCAVGIKFCGDIVIPKSDTDRVFFAQGASATNPALAVGCARAKVNQDALPLSIKMVHNLPPSVCGNGVVEPLEQCEPSGANDPVCDANCHSKEILLSKGSTANNTLTGSPGDKVNPFFLWPSASGDAGRFMAFFGDTSPGPANTQVTMGVLGDSFAPVATPQALQSASIYLPNGSGLPPVTAPKSQMNPSAAMIGSTYYVVFQDNDTLGANGIDIHLRSMGSAFNAQQPVAGANGSGAIGINGAGGNGEPNIQISPAMALGPGNALFIAWLDEGTGAIFGRTFTPSGATLGTENEISSGSGNTRVRIAATSWGWLAVWQGSAGVRMRALTASGAPAGNEIGVNASGGTHPDIAVLPDGRYAVTWSAAGTSGADIFVQRFDANGHAVAGDQTQPVNTLTTGDQITPAIAAGATAAASFFVVAWLDGPTKHVRARLLGGSTGFLFNNVDGQDSDFQASRDDGRTRANPAVAAGGSGPYVAFGWEDQTTTAPFGIIARRFPVPSQ